MEEDYNPYFMDSVYQINKPLLSNDEIDSYINWVGYGNYPDIVSSVNRNMNKTRLTDFADTNARVQSVNVQKTSREIDRTISNQMNSFQRERRPYQGVPVGTITRYYEGAIERPIE